jgi:hypothetical protein
MIMKKVIACIATAMLLATFTPIQSIAEKKPTSISATEKEAAELKALSNRLNEINAMDRSTMSRSEKKEIRKELRAIKKEVYKHHKHNGGGGAIYISGGLLVFILILIIIF